ncbi:hypothetical protein POSPLADRAFT_1151301 [Postia placenta MAD-698-R-SB12]|uniref:CENP-V/GFA domain-containing protein n=1 Tax=Postia placenta MAD-698-R-SB12 TaxID=670580 RepID=A0A1X6MQN0_9APHY|nr:hypothetical protein POSPLADRAFT_1151301 [Postia placenta MAD-698-R-SB12]OSX58734.1 hypothetical protein POSPLADRAFT_1151301 [Postia placenta MAD-698-R-SB12]
MSTNHVKVNAHPDSTVHKGTHSNIPHPPPGDRPHCSPTVNKPIPDTGWRGQPLIPSKDGGTREKDFIHKPPYKWESEGDLFKPKYKSECWCGNVSFEFHGDPLDAKHCHCRQCQRLHGAPFQWAVIFPKTSVRMVKNKDNSLHFFSTEDLTGMHSVPCKVSCNVCRSPLFDEGRNTVLAYPSSFRFPEHKVPFNFQPTAHIFYSQRVMEIPDGIPKWAGHRGESELLQELTEEEGILPKYKGKPAQGQIHSRETTQPGREDP